MNRALPSAVSRSARLSALVERVPQGARLADVATDHAWAAIGALVSGRAQYAIGIDLREAPLAQARLHASRCRVTDRLALRLGDGLWPLEPGEVDTVMIAGVGGALMVKMLEARELEALGVQRLILQTYTEQEQVRALIAARGWRLDGEALCEERGMFYVTWSVAVERGEARALDERALWLGEDRGEVFERWCAARRAELEMILRAVPRGHVARAAHEARLGWLDGLLLAGAALADVGGLELEDGGHLVDA
jgi:tRNA (adenine22-N1)-methyltransferase